MPLKFYYDIMSQPSRALWLFLRMTKLPHEDCPVALRKGEHRTPEYAKVNPLQLVPAIDDNGFKMKESVAIMRYLTSVYDVADHWYPRDVKRRARLDEYLAWQHMNVRMTAAMFFRTKIIMPRMTGEPVDEEKAAMHRGQLERVLDQLEAVFLADTSYIASHSISFADILAICELMQPMGAGLDVREGRPVLRAWMDRVKNDLEPHFSEAHKLILRTGQLHVAGKL